MKDGKVTARTAEITASRLRAGTWEARLAFPGGEAPAIDLWHADRRIGSVTVAGDERPGEWLLSAPIPAETISDGVQTFLLRDATSGETLAHFSILAGAALDHDIRAEMDLIRAELDLLKRAFRRHCAEGDS